MAATGVAIKEEAPGQHRTEAGTRLEDGDMHTWPQLVGRPSDLGYRFPAEWEPHDGCWMGWPERLDNWYKQALPAQLAWVEVATAISRFEPLTVCASHKQWETARKMLPPQVRVLEMSMDDAWLRDTGPMFVVKERPNGVRELAGVDWAFNSWGGKDEGCYPKWDLDQQLAKKILEVERVPRFNNPMVLEGGSVHLDGEGTVLTTEQCLLNRNRNPNLSREQIEEQLRLYLGAEKILWLPRGLVADEDTDGHIDNIACFARPGMVLLTWPHNEKDPQYEVSREAFEVLVNSTDAKGRKIEVVKLPMPGPLYYRKEEVHDLKEMSDGYEREAGKRLAASYANFYMPNGGIVVPGFNQPDTDKQAVETLQKVFPDRVVVQVSRGRDILLGGGNIHCITQQQPAKLVEGKGGQALTSEA